jgi:protein-tyrosine phosphatase
MIDKLVHHLIKGQNVLVHCRAGIGRTGLVAASVLVRTGIDPEVALRLVSTARTLVVPDTAEQRTWVLNFTAGG